MFLTRFSVIAQAAAPPSAAPSADVFRQIAPWAIVLIAIVLIGGVVLYFIRRSIKSNPSSGAGGFTLQDLRDLHARGEISDEEFQRAKAQMIGRLAAAATTKDREPESTPDVSAGGDNP